MYKKKALKLANHSISHVQYYPTYPRSALVLIVLEKYKCQENDNREKGEIDAYIARTDANKCLGKMFTLYSIFYHVFS